MTLSVTELRDLVAKRFPDVEKLNDSVVRFTRTEGTSPFAIYYMDVAGDLPTTADSLTKYQDRIIGSHYFEDRRSLQWSNYLYFVLSDSQLAANEMQKAKELIENDRNYARKFVISEAEIESVLDPSVVAPESYQPRTDILSVWRTRLVEAGLDKAIFNDDDLPKRLARIVSPPATPKPAPAQLSPSPSTKPAPFISSLNLTRYRPFPILHFFEFGTVNLIHGPNASGKTSLLEAIELFYCGRNKRNPNHESEYELTAVLADGRTEKATETRKPRDFRRHNLEWYGQSEVKTNDLYRSFAQFNFLDTDAAASLRDSAIDVEEHLSKLLVGPDASKTWNDMERLRRELASHIRELHPLEAQVRAELAAIEKQLQEAAGVKQESDAIRRRVDEMLQRHNWKVPRGNSDEVATSLLSALSELAAIIEQAEELSWIDSPVSFRYLDEFARKAGAASATAQPLVNRLAPLIERQTRLSQVIERKTEALSLTKELRTFFSAGFPSRVTERAQQQEVIAKYTDWFSGFDAAFLKLLSASNFSASVSASYQNARSKRAEAERTLATARRQYDDLVKLRDRSVRLGQELRELAATILKGSSAPDVCPLCHTSFPRGQLAKHMRAGVDEHFEQHGQALLAQIREQETGLRAARDIEAALAWLSEFRERAGISVRLPFPSVIARLREIQKEQSIADERLATINKELRALNSRGFSVKRSEEFKARLTQLEIRIDVSSLEGLDRSVSDLERSVADATEEVRARAKEIDDVKDSLREILTVDGDSASAFNTALSQLKERLTTTQRLRSNFAENTELLRWPAERPIAELKVAADSVRRVAAELQASLGKEKLAREARAAAAKRKGQLEKQLGDIAPQLRLYQQAHAVLDELRRDYSLSDAMKSALDRNRSVVESIFARIHAPAEFSALGPDIGTLVRKVDGSRASLQEISTGQRAAFALSIFLAQNSQLTVGPSVVLIDDPIAYVDDLNSLSFLDYLREVALTGRRQIYFATANDKLATLFERKFDFLGPNGFKRFDLKREHPTVGRSVH